MRDSRCSFVAVGSDLDVSSKIRNWCARAERSPEQVRKKLHDWGAGDQSDRWIAALQEEDYVNPKRFAQAFVHDHLEFRNWGPAKIMSALTQVHRISGDQVRQALAEQGKDAVDAAAGPPNAVGGPIAAISSRSLGAPAASIGLDPAAAAR